MAAVRPAERVPDAPSSHFRRGLVRAIVNADTVFGVVAFAFFFSDAGVPTHLVAGSILFTTALLARWALRHGHVERAATLSLGALFLAITRMSFAVGHQVGAHTMLLPAPVLIQLTFANVGGRLAMSVITGVLFMYFEVAKLEPEEELPDPDLLRVANRALLVVCITLLTHFTLKEHGALTGSLAATRAAHHKMKESAAARMTFLTMMSHEIRTPLNAVIAFSDMLCAALKDDKEHADMAETVRSSSQALLAIINDVLDFSRVDSGQLTLSPALVELDNVVDGTLTALHATASAKGLTLCADVQLPLPCPVEVDAVRLRQVLTNLVGNALKFTEQGHVLLTVTSADGAGLEFAVSDTGCGIPSESLQAIFEPYQQADQRLVRTHDGTGLGLAICSRIATAMGGSLTVESELGRGSTFRLRVPLTVQAPQPETPSTASHVEVAVASSPVLQSTLRSAVARLNPTPGPPVVVTDDPQRTGERVVLVTDPLHPVESPQQHVRRLLLPVRRAALLDAVSAPPAEAVPASAAEQPKLNLGRDVLVAEDNNVNQKVIAAMLKRLGCTFRLAVDGADCVEQFKARRPDVVLMDCHMPVMDGFEAARAIRAIDEDVPIFALTADALEAANEEALASGMNRVLTKPIVMGTLQGVLADPRGLTLS